ncbi:MAG: CcmD family protein [Balneolaceae bacterium]
MQELQESDVDTLTKSYSDQWGAMDNLGEASSFVQFMASNDLIFVVLGVSLVIWFVLLFYMVRVDRKVSKLENELTDKEENS